MLIGKLLFAVTKYITVMTRVKAISLLSGGLDSILATELIRRQGIEVVAFNVKTPFGIPKKDGTSEASQAAEQLKVPLKVVAADYDYLRMLRKPKHGYGKNLNPCVDCKIFILKQAKKYAREIGAEFLFTGEVLGERPMSQHGPALKTIAEEAGLKGKLLRPLSAKLLAETVAEKKGLVDRSRLLSIQGRSRKPQFELAKEYGITMYPSPAGGCLLTCEEYAKKLRDLFENKKRVSIADVTLLRVGRHFRMGKNKFIVGRNETENKFLSANKLPSDYCFELAKVVGPVTLLEGPKTKGAIKTAAELTASYSDAKDGEVTVNYGKVQLDKSIEVSPPARTEVEKLRVGNKQR
jgi:tRNA-uridine 2-sulfurtransferase